MARQCEPCLITYCQVPVEVPPLAEQEPSHGQSPQHVAPIESLVAAESVWPDWNLNLRGRAL